MDLINSVMSLKAASFSQQMDIAVVKSRLEADRMLADMITEAVQSSKAAAGNGRGQVVDISV